LCALGVPAFSQDACPRPEAGSAVNSPPEIRSAQGKLEVNFFFRNSVTPDGHMRYCYISNDGTETPTLRVHPGDQVILKLKNELTPNSHAMAMPAGGCAGGMMDASSTNLHFHGLSVPPVCHQDETVKTLVPAASTFEYGFQIPKDEPPGLYWYHPHPHGFSEQQVLGGASGALIVEGIDQVNHTVKGLPERVLILRDQWVRGSKIDAKKPDPNKPGKDLSLNFVPVLYPEYVPAVIRMKPGERQFWRVLNASADTYIDLKVQPKTKPQFLGVIGLDGVPFGFADGSPADHIVWQSHILLPPAGRAEFIFNGPALGEATSLITQAVETGPTYDSDSPPPVNGVVAADDDNSPTRPLADIVAAADAPEPGSQETSLPLLKPAESPLSQTKPTRERKLFFSETAPDAEHPAVFYITEDGKTPVPYDPNARPNITVHQGDVEDWTIENRSNETHAFHIHQTHFVVLERHSVPVDEPHLRDTINVPYWDGFTPLYPSIKIRIDFRDPNIVGTFPYHCHILQHEDGGMMGTVRVEPKPR
jgi:FtsP/CotA-like multicopper oxidase with cupredoxin domain